jgi:NAD-dependent deacetylase
MTESEIAARLHGNVFVLSGAGISVASGLSVFRGPGGLYEGKNAYQLASPEGFDEDPPLVWNWYLERIRNAINAKPNPAHHALAELDRLAKKVTIVTSNVDLLHEIAGSKNVFKLHGNIMQTRCTRCATVDALKVKELPSKCTQEVMPRCGCGGLLRPNIVWFGEYPWPEAVNAVNYDLPDADILLEVGMSGVVSYGFTQTAVRWKVPAVRINPDASPEPGVECIKEGAEVALPRLVALALNAEHR